MADNRPVLIGIAQQTWRERDVQRTPLDALAEVATAALDDAGCANLLRDIDALASVPFLANQVPGLAELMPANPGAALCRRLGLKARTYSTEVGGNTPQLLVNHFADTLARGEHRAVLLCGGEVFATLSGALKNGEDLSAWPDGGDTPAVLLGDDRPPCSEAERAHGLFEPVNTYPLFESALRHANGWSDSEHRRRLGGMIARLSEVAEGNPHAWRRQRWSAEAALDTADGNRMISYPYTRVMNSVLAVDMAAAVVMTTAGHARALGIDPSRLVYLRGGADAVDIWNVSERPLLHRSPGIRAAATEVLAQAGLEINAVDLFDIYSCFPSAVQVACEALGIAVDDPRGVSVTGGMMLFGGPGNNYSMHGIAEMAARLRAGTGRHGLVTANGNYLTKHALGLYSTEPGAEPWPAPGRGNPRARLDSPTPLAVDPAPRGTGTVEAFTVSYQGEEPVRGIALGRMPDGRRFLANTEADPAMLSGLEGEDMVGVTGRVTPGEPVNHIAF
ncbi:acetyl-CoA acetyltransferase [Parahaliea mediterranea]|uniref:Acetyl-CoA acetyltransferase n=1 Tax=Parahaliea mediterranea TaxID=651086 RepID=A0A939DH14_9GAMM|nr:acetyl-CoA acetyltransferase [Parahaliea mediterranea]MBN7797934.1 acetyl-CoA acetyltransferase [Parahaliea mediterranea]